MTDHERATPQPWKYDGDGYASVLYGADGSALIEEGAILDTDAALIVEAVNNYDRLLRVEAAARAAMDNAEYTGGPYYVNLDHGDALKAALSEPPS